jgi:UDP-glucose 4-epimerase
MVRAFEKANGVKIPVRMAPRRAGDIAACYADPTLARQELDWQATRDLDDMVRDAWNWQSQNPNGYKD